MKFPSSNFQSPISPREEKLPPSRRRLIGNPQSAIRNPQCSRGIALVITLILLSVTLIMAVAFLALARRERSAVTTSTDTATARLATESALAAAQAQIAANILATTNPYDFHLLVSTNWISAGGYDPTGGPNNNGASLTNVSYNYPNGNPLTVNDLLQNLANLQILPRAPVFIVTNTAANMPLDFRFYLDLNRNGIFDTNGWVTNLDATGAGLGFASLLTGDPEWIGVLAHPDQPYGPNNPFIARYAFLAQPVGNGLDLNYLHNQTYNNTLSASDGYFRNEGVGSWELNFASFLTDLNTNQWNAPTIWNAALNSPYNYQQPNFANTGAAFDDARALLSWRYAGNYSYLGVPLPYFQNGLINQGIDGYTVGRLMTNLFVPGTLVPANKSWAGSDSPNRFYSLVSDLFDNSKTAVGVPVANVNSGNYLSGRLWMASTNTATYDRYTFYRMLDQIGTDSSGDDGKLNLNYDNTDGRGNVVAGMETNMIPWTPSGLFTNAAERMLRYYTAKWHDQNYRDYTNTFGMMNTNAFGVTNIPVYINGRFVYTPAVHRILQLAVNLYDASTNNSARLGNDFPSVFRPMFTTVNNGSYRNIYISGFQEISSLNSFSVGQPPLDQPVDVTAGTLAMNAGRTTAFGNAYGVPWIVGAKKGFPAFNQLYMRNTVQVTRKLQVSRQNGAIPGATATNEMFTMSITNRIGFSFWNSYNNNYTSSVPGGLTIYGRELISMTLTNAQRTWNTFYSMPAIVQFPFLSNNFTVWPGSQWNTYSGQAAPSDQTADPRSFISGYLDFGFLPESDFEAQINDFVPSGTGVWDTATTTVPAFPQFGVATTNWFQAYILDGPHIIDYVQFSGPNDARDMSDEIRDKTSDPNYNANLSKGLLMWNTNGYMGAPQPSLGVVDQVMVSRLNTSGNINQFWRSPPGMPAGFQGVPAAEAAYFNGFFNSFYTYKGKQYINTNLVVQVPYTPTRTAWEYTSWQVNDPLVHSLAGDLSTATRQTGIHKADVVANADYPQPNLNALPDRYQPWGRSRQMAQVGNVDSYAFHLGYRDPLVWGSDDWDFPAGKYPTVGWIGRVHRGTPWQTVYLKSSDIRTNQGVGIGLNTWAQWTGNTQTSFGNLADASRSAPVDDSDLFDLFTTRFNDNAAHGSLSVNQTHLAAWSAVFGGLVGLGNITDIPASYTPPVITNYVVQPAGNAGNASPLGLLVNGTGGINSTRLNFRNSDGVRGSFEHVGDILRAPLLSEQSPLLNWSDATHRQFDISDKLYEWLPQQVMGLLRVSSTPRYVIYCYGQALRPAPNSFANSGGQFFNMCTNYQIVAESAARAVLRVNRNVVGDTNGVPASTNYTTTVESFNTMKPD